MTGASVDDMLVVMLSNGEKGVCNVRSWARVGRDLREDARMRLFTRFTARISSDQSILGTDVFYICVSSFDVVVNDFQRISKQLHISVLCTECQDFMHCSECYEADEV